MNFAMYSMIRIQLSSSGFPVTERLYELFGFDWSLPAGSSAVDAIIEDKERGAFWRGETRREDALDSFVTPLLV